MSKTVFQLQSTGGYEYLLEKKNNTDEKKELLTTPMQHAVVLNHRNGTYYVTL